MAPSITMVPSINAVPSLQALCLNLVGNYIRDGTLSEIVRGKRGWLYREIYKAKTLKNVADMFYIPKQDYADTICMQLLDLFPKLKEMYLGNNNCLVYGNVQSGKTNLIIASSWICQHVLKIHNVITLRNILGDVLQFKQRVNEFNKKYIKDTRFYLSIVYSRDLGSLEDGPKCILSIFNRSQLDLVAYQMAKKVDIGIGYMRNGSIFHTMKGNDNVEARVEDEGYTYINKKLYKYKIKNQSFQNNILRLSSDFTSKSGSYSMYDGNMDLLPNDYALHIDEVDATYGISSFNFLKEKAKIKFGFTATSLKNIIVDNFNKVVKLDKPTNYVGVLDINYKVIPNDSTIDNIDYIFETFLKKQHGIMLYNITGFKDKQKFISKKIKEKYTNKICVIVQNSDGIAVLNESTRYPIKKGYKVIQNDKYNTHTFKKYEFSKVLQLLKNEGKYTHFVIIARRVASRGMSYVSEDYVWHLTDQVVLNYETTADQAIQSLRVCGIYEHNRTVSLWTTRNVIKKIIKYYTYNDRCMEMLSNTYDVDSVLSSLEVSSIFSIYNKSNDKNPKTYRWVHNEELQNYTLSITQG